MIDVWDPTSEGPWIVENLRQSDLDVGVIGADDVVRTHADLVIVAGDAPGALKAIKLLRDDGDHGDVPVILVGVPEGTAHPGDGPGFGAEAVFLRPVSFAALLAKVYALLESSPRAEVSRIQAPVPERTMQLSDPDDPASSQVLSRKPEASKTSWRPREPTMQLGQSAVDPSAIADGHEVSSVTGGRSRTPEPVASTPSTTATGRRLKTASGSSPISSFPGTGSQPGTGRERRASDLEIPPDKRARVSPWLADLLNAADRRVFPNRSPIALYLLAADEPPDELVPAELLDMPTFRIDEPVVEDPIDAFTYIGGPAVPMPMVPSTAEEAASTNHGLSSSPPAAIAPPAIPRRVHTALDPPPEARPVRRELTTATELPPLVTNAPGPIGGGAWPDDDTVLGRTSVGGNRRGQLGAGGALRLLWRVAALGLDAICELRLGDDTPVRMTFLAGELRAFDGPIAKTVLDGLRRRGRATEAPADEAGAEAALQARVDAGQLGRFERDRLMREARERLLVKIVASEEADFVLRRLDDTQPGRVLSRARMMRRPLRAALSEVAREALDAERVALLLGDEQPGLALGPEREAALAAAELTSELVELLVRMDGHRLKDFLAAAPTEPGLAGLLYALVAGDVLVLTDPPDASFGDARAAVRELIVAAAARAVDADYFAILGIGSDATSGEVEGAYDARHAELAAIPLEALGLGKLGASRAEALEALDEARAVLSSADLRRRYALAITPVFTG